MVGEQQREIVLELSKELGKHNKLLEKAIDKEERLISKVNRIEEQIMAREIYNYTSIQNQIKYRKENHHLFGTEEDGKLIKYNTKNDLRVDLIEDTIHSNEHV